MSYCRQEGKNRIIVATKEELSKPSTIKLQGASPDDPRVSLKLYMQDAQVCPSCVAGMSFGPCGHDWLQFYRAWKTNDSDSFASRGQAVSDCLERHAKYYPDMNKGPPRDEAGAASALTDSSSSNGNSDDKAHNGNEGQK